MGIELMTCSQAIDAIRIATVATVIWMTGAASAQEMMLPNVSITPHDSSRFETYVDEEFDGGDAVAGGSEIADGSETVEGGEIERIVEPSYVSPGDGTVTGSQSFLLDDGVGGQIANNFNAAPDFASGLVIAGPDVAMKIGGYVKADLIHDFDAIDSTDSFATTSIPTSGPGRENTRFHARQSRLSFDTRWRTDGRVARAFVEADFFGGEPSDSSNFRLRHAYGTLGGFTAGQTWSTFTDPTAVPQTLDFEGAVSNVNRRQGLVRWEQPVLADGLSMAVAVENPQILIEAPSLVTGEGRTKSPDFISRLRLARDWGNLQGAFVLRELGFQPTGGSVISKTAWGFNFTGSALLTDGTTAYSQITFGEGVGSYRGSPDVVATGPASASILPVFGWMIGVHQQWPGPLTSNFTFSQLSLEDLPGQDPSNLRDTTYLAANLIANPYDRVFVGIEYLYGIREDVSGAEGAAHRIQTSFGFYLP